MSLENEKKRFECGVARLRLYNCRGCRGTTSQHFQTDRFRNKESFRDPNSHIVVATLTQRLISQEMRKIDGIGAKAYNKIQP
jgi:hypothetical protein